MFFLFINKTWQLNNLKIRIAINAKISVFSICVEATIYLLYNLHDCTFKKYKLAPTATVLYIRSFACMNVRAEPIYVHKNQCTKIPNLSSPGKVKRLFGPMIEIGKDLLISTVIQCNQVYFSSSNILTDTTVIVKD